MEADSGPFFGACMVGRGSGSSLILGSLVLHLLGVGCVLQVIRHGV